MNRGVNYHPKIGMFKKKRYIHLDVSIGSSMKKCEGKIWESFCTPIDSGGAKQRPIDDY